MPAIDALLFLVALVFFDPAECLLHLLHGIAEVGKLFQSLFLSILKQMPDVQCLVRLPVLFRIAQGDVQLQTHENHVNRHQLLQTNITVARL